MLFLLYLVLLSVPLFSVISYLWLSDFDGKITDATDGCLDWITHFPMFIIGLPGTILAKVIAAKKAAKRNQEENKQRNERIHSYYDNLSKFKSSESFLVNKCKQRLESYIHRCIIEGCTTPIRQKDAFIVFLFSHDEVYRADYISDSDDLPLRYSPYFSVKYSEFGYETISSKIAVIAFADLIGEMLCKDFPQLHISIFHDDPEREYWYESNWGNEAKVVVDISSKVRLLKKL